MKKRMKTVIALFCMTAILSGCSSSGDSGTTIAKQNDKAAQGQSTENQSTEGKNSGSQGNDSQESAIQSSESQGTENKNMEAGEITVGFSNDTDSWDPCTGFGYTGSPLYSTLVKINGDNKLENDLATDYQMSEDGLTWTFKIRDGVKFTNGEELNASDVAFTFNTTKEKATYVDLTMLDSCTAGDDPTVEFKL